MLELEKNALVWGVSGNLGGGKTLTTVYFMVNAISQGYMVVTNITLDIDRICHDYGEWCRNLYLHVSLDGENYVDPFDFPTGDRRGSGGRRRVIVVFDECAEWFDQYVNAKEPKIQRLWSWIRHSSKRSQDVFLIVQRPEYLHKVLRILVARWIMVDDLAVYRLPYLRAKLPFMGGFIVARPFDRSGLRVGGCSFVRKVKWGRYYDTAECLNSEGAKKDYVYSAPPVEVNLKPWVILWLVSLGWLMIQM